MRRVSARRSVQGSSPSTDAVPPVGMRIPVSILIEVDFPAPFGPMKARRSPGATSKLIERTASIVVRRRLGPVSNERDRPSTWIAELDFPEPDVPELDASELNDR